MSWYFIISAAVDIVTMRYWTHAASPFDNVYINAVAF